MGLELQDDPEHRRTFPDRKCAVGTAGCKGRVLVYGPALMCEGHILAWEESEHAGKVERMRAWARQERAKAAS